jgi:hypothetical protein
MAAVSPKELRQLVNRLEAEAASRPGLYKLRVVALALLGYGYLLLILVLSLGLPIVFVAGLFTRARAVFIQLVLKLGIPLLVLAAVLVRSLWVRIPAPVGIPLRKEQAPLLFETARRLSRALGAPRVHHVILDGSFNASVVQIPRLGVLGWSRNYLTVGLPLLDALTPEQIRGRAGKRAR